jgi:hypothetical protein
VSCHPREQLAAACRSWPARGRDLLALPLGVVVVDEEPRVLAGAGERGVAPAGGEIAGEATTIARSTVAPCIPWPVSA